MTNEFDPTPPAEALAAIQATRTAVADRMVLPWYYDALYAVAVGGMVASQALPSPKSTLAILACVGLLLLYATAWKKKVGAWVYGTTPKNARWVAIGGGLVAGALMIVSLYAARTLGLWWVPLAMGAVAAVVAFFINRLWVRVYRRVMEAGQ